jgi:hypothetical protein
VISRQILGAFAGSHHLETRSACPVHLLTDQCRLIAIGEAVNYARCTRMRRKRRATQSICLDIHHDDVLALAAAKQHMLNTCRG